MPLLNIVSGRRWRHYRQWTAPQDTGEPTVLGQHGNAAVNGVLGLVDLQLLALIGNGSL